MAKLKAVKAKAVKKTAKASIKAKPKKPAKRVKAKAKDQPKPKAKRKVKKRKGPVIQPLPIQDMEAFGSFVLDCIMLTLLNTHDGEFLPNGRPKIDADLAAKVIGEATGTLGMMLGFLHAHLYHDLGMENMPPAAFHKELSMGWFRGWQERCKGCSHLMNSVVGETVNGDGSIRVMKIPDSMRGAVETIIAKITGAAAPHAATDDDPDLSKKPN